MIGPEEIPATRAGTCEGIGDGRERWDATAKRIGRYVVLGMLGSGGMGDVFSALDEHLKRRVAIKRSHRRSDDESTRRRSLREAQALARLSHPNIVTVYEAFEVDAQLCIVMELVAGQTLREWLKERPRPRAEVLGALLQAGRGIAAAHAAGLVHRDLKPDNIMIDENGRVRVMDFGLAQGVELREDTPDSETTWPYADDPLSGSNTHNGVFVGTPGYMAPEQQLGLAADVRSDVFGYCVLAFEALHGLRPFRGRDNAAVREATLAGRVVEPPGDEVPAWLDAVIRRGLVVEPAARWPMMEPLLDALARDPLALRRRRWRAFAVLMLAGVLVTAVVVAVAALREANERAMRETAAATRLTAVEATITRAEAEGDAATAEAAFRTFVSDPDHRHTRALTRAWLGRGDRRTGDAAGARAAYSEAYVSARTTDDERAALRSLSLMFAKDWDGLGLGRGVDLLRAREADDLELAELGFRAALWQRDLPGAVAELGHVGHSQVGWRPLLEHLSRSRSLPLRVGELTVLPAGSSARIAVRDLDGTHVVLLDDALNEVGRWRDDARISLVPRTSWAITQTAHEARVIDLSSGAVLGRGAPGIAPFAPFDATGDGVPELFFGRMWPRYGFQRWDGLGGAETLERGAHPGTDASNSTFDTHAVGDLDGDGVDELAIGFGPWGRFDLRVFRPDARGELELIAAHRLGRMSGLAIVHRGARRLLAALVDNSCPAPEVFLDAPHTGGPPGVHMFEWVGGALVEVDFIGLPGSFGEFKGVDLKAVGDLDGDGLEELAFALARVGGPWLLVLRQTASGFEPQLLAGVQVLAGVQLDADAALELLVKDMPGEGLRVLGLGDEAMPPPPRTILDPPPPALTDPSLVERWNRANDLAALAQQGSAAASLRDGALLVTDRPMKSALLDRAGELFASEGRATEVLALEHDVHDDPQVRGRAQARQIEALSRLGRHEDALAEASALLRAPARTAEQADSARALVEDLSALLAPDAQIDLPFDAPLARAWRIVTPGALRRDPGRSVLEFSIPANSMPVAELPIQWGGGPIALDFEIDIERLEYGSCVEISIADASDRRWLGGAFCGQGGSGLLQAATWLKIGSVPWTLHEQHKVESGIHHQNVQLHMAYFPGRGAVNVTLVADGKAHLFTWPVATPPQPGRHRLIVGSFVASPEFSLALGDIRRIRVRGAQIGSWSPGDAVRHRPAQLLAEHEPRAAIEALMRAEPPPPRAEMLRLLALAELGDLDGLTGAASAVLPHIDDLQWFGDLALALRRHPLAAAALRSAAGPRLLPALGSIWGIAKPHRNDRPMRDELLDGLQEIERLVPRTDAEREGQRRLLDARAELWQRSGEPGRADRDLEASAMVEPAGP